MWHTVTAPVTKLSYLMNNYANENTLAIHPNEKRKEKKKMETNGSSCHGNCKLTMVLLLQIIIYKEVLR